GDEVVVRAGERAGLAAVEVVDEGVGEAVREREAAADVGDAGPGLQLGLDAFECGDPLVDDMNGRTGEEHGVTVPGRFISCNCDVRSSISAADDRRPTSARVVG